jgi:Druantia protein DruA
MSRFRYRGREISTEDILYIRALIERHPGESRRKLSVRLCEAWQWRQANGALRDMVCRGLLLMLERAGQIELPLVSYVRHNPLIRRVRPEAVLIDATPIESRLCNLQPLKLEQVRRTAQEPLFNSLMEQHHYLGYEQPVGEHLKFLVWAQPPQRRGPVAGDPGAGRPIACLAWSSAPRHLGSRDRYIGWDAAARRSRIRFIVCFRQGCVTARGPDCYFQSAAEVGEIEGYECHSCG